VIVVSNASPLIYLAKLGKIELLHELFGQVVIPPAVYQEVVVLGTNKPGAEEVKAATWICQREVSNKAEINLTLLNLVNRLITCRDWPLCQSELILHKLKEMEE